MPHRADEAIVRSQAAPPLPAKQRFGVEMVIEQITLGAVALASVAVGVLDFAGLLDNTFLANRIPTMTLLAVGMITAYLLVERRGSWRRLDQSLQESAESARQLTGRIAALEADAERTNAFFEGLSGDRFSELRLLYGLRSFNNSITRHEIRADASQTFELWADTLREATQFYAFNYVSPGEVWATKGWAFNIAHSLQIARLNHGCDIKRVFIIDDAAEYQAIQELMMAQSQIGIDVKWVFKSEVEKVPIVIQHLREIGTWDFVVTDGDFLFRVDLDNNRSMKKCSLARERQLHQKALRVFTEALHLAQNPNVAPSP